MDSLHVAPCSLPPALSYWSILVREEVRKILFICSSPCSVPNFPHVDLTRCYLWTHFFPSFLLIRFTHTHTCTTLTSWWWCVCMSYLYQTHKECLLFLATGGFCHGSTARISIFVSLSICLSCFLSLVPNETWGETNNVYTMENVITLYFTTSATGSPETTRIRKTSDWDKKVCM